MYISRVSINNIRCFDHIELSFDLEGDTPPCTVIVGDNATGKSCLLRSISIGLCDESSAAGLLKESEEDYIRRGAEETGGTITMHLTDRYKPKEEYRIETKIEQIPIQNGKGEKHSIERVRQKTFPSKETFPWGRLFACAYGAGRGTSGTGDVAGYSVINAVYNMFNYSEGLQNPELTIRRMMKHFPEREAFSILKSIMPKTENMDLTDSGLTVDGPWGSRMPLRDLADGYKSTFLWVTDLLGWALNYDSKIASASEISGIVLIDEIEQHLHPKWQRGIVSLLREAFPGIQFIATTHSPLVAANAARICIDDVRSKLYHLGFEGKTVRLSEVREFLGELDFDQILSSEAFDYIYTVNPRLETILREASILAGKEARTPKEQDTYDKLKAILKEIMFPQGKTLIERTVERDYYAELEKKIEDFKKVLHG